MEYYFDPDDKLDRIKYAEFLKSMLENCDQYRREDSEGAYVIAIDSPWGTGKTRFAKMLRNYLENRTKDMGADSLPGENAAFNAIYYNSWETDFSDDALLPLVYTILESPEMELKRFDSEGKKTLNKFKKVAIDIAKIAGYTILHNVCGETVTQMAKAAETAATETEADPLKKYKERLAVLNAFKSDLQDVIAQTRQKNLVIIIDELDRCRPTFAIQTLELAKHLFSVKGLIFIFALDIEQLSCSVKTIYGTSMDASGYLCRFFDYIGKMPNPNQRNFIKLCLEQHRTFISETTFWNRKIPEFIDELSKSFNLSLRDIATIVKTYLLIYDAFLTKCTYPQLHHLYLFLVSLKYKNVFLYSNFLLGKKLGNEIESAYKSVQKYLPAFSFVVKGVLVNQLQKLSVGIPLQHCEFEVLPSSVDVERREPLTRPIRIETTKEENLRGMDTLVIYTRVKDPNTTRWIHGSSFNFDLDNIYGDVLDYNDLVKWNMIRDLSLGEYYYQQLEMFDFALLADDTESKS